MMNLSYFRKQHKIFLEILVWMAAKRETLKSTDPRSPEVQSFAKLVDTFFGKQAIPLDRAWEELSQEERDQWLEETRRN